MFAIKSSADDGRYGAVTRTLSGGKIVRCPKCNEAYILYSETSGLLSRSGALLSQYLNEQCPHHVEFIAADEAA